MAHLPPLPVLPDVTVSSELLRWVRWEGGGASRDGGPGPEPGGAARQHVPAAAAVCAGAGGAPYGVHAGGAPHGDAALRTRTQPAVSAAGARPHQHWPVHLSTHHIRPIGINR
eukprot:9500407-Pyramimonas_sp.AAC.1